jgi:hypothetical protein
MQAESQLLSRTGKPAAWRVHAFSLNRHQNGVWLPISAEQKTRFPQPANTKMGEIACFP